MDCEICGFDLPGDWPGCNVRVPVPADEPFAADLPVVVLTRLCNPCQRMMENPQDVRDAAMTEYRALPPHQPPGRHAEPAAEPSA